MEININTPSLLFPAISLLLLAYTNRFLGLAALIRNLHGQYHNNPNCIIMGQIVNLKKRITLIKNMQAIGILSLLCCSLSMFLLFAGKTFPGEVVFGISLVFMMLSLLLSLWEIRISVNALTLHLSDLEYKDKDSSRKGGDSNSQGKKSNYRSRSYNSRRRDSRRSNRPSRDGRDGRDSRDGRDNRENRDGSKESYNKETAPRAETKSETPQVS